MANRPARLRQRIQGGGKGMDGRIRMIAADRLREPDGRIFGYEDGEGADMGGVGACERAQARRLGKDGISDGSLQGEALPAIRFSAPGGCGALRRMGWRIAAGKGAGE